MLKKLTVVAALIVAATATLASDSTHVAKSFELRDGATVYVFKDGRMAMEDRQGRSLGMKPGHVMETKDGQKIIMVGNELARLDVIKADHIGGN